MKKIFLVALILIFWLRGLTANKYFASNGNDANTGTIISPFKTITKLNSIWSTLLPGDSVLFRRGDTFYGTISVTKSGTLAAPIKVGAYGSGSLPIITGLTDLVNWVSAGTNLWICNANTLLPATVKVVLSEDTLAPMGRYPNYSAANQGYLTYESSNARIQITDNSLLNTPNWTGAQVVLRVNHFVTETRTISSHTGTQVNWVTPTTDNLLNGMGFFFQASLQTLDQQGEWYYNPTTKRITMYSTSMPTNVKAAALSSLVTSTTFTNVTFTNINFSGSNDYGFNLGVCPSCGAGGNRFSILNCTVKNTTVGINTSQHSFLNINNNTITDNGSGGIFISNGDNSIIRRNYVRNTAQRAGSILDGSGSGNGISTKGSDITIDSNQVILTGYTGIRWDGDDVYVGYNLVDTSNNVKNDGGAFYHHEGAGARTNVRLIKNIALNGIGAAVGSIYPTLRQAQGIYLDLLSSHTLMEGNIVANCENGIMLNFGASNNHARANTLFNNKNNFYVNMRGGAQLSRNDTIRKNILFSYLNNQVTALYQSSNNDIGSLGIVDSNYHARPILQTTIIKNQNTNQTLPMFRTSFPQYEVNGQISPVTVSNANQILFLYNATFAATVTPLTGGWKDVFNTSYSTSVTLQPFTAVVLMSTGSLITPTVTWANPSAITYPAPLTGTQLNASTGIAGTFTYTPASGTVLNAGSQTLSVLFTPTDGATYSTASKTVTIVVNKATATLAYSNLSRPYTGLPLAPTITTSPAGLSTVNTLYNGVGATPINAGSYSVTSALINQNYSAPPISNTFVITKLTPTISWPTIADITYGTALSSVQYNQTASVSGSFVNSPVIGNVPNAGLGQTLSTNFTPTDAVNYNSVLNTTRTINVLKATATLTLSNLNQVFDNTPKSVTVTSAPPSLGTIATTYNGSSTPPTAPGTYAVVSTLTNSNYQATPATGNLIISNIVGSIEISNTSQVYTGSPLGVTVTTNPVAAYTVTYNGSATVPTNAATYTAIATLNDLSAADTAVFTITKASAVLLLSNLTATYDGFPHAATITTVPGSLTVTSLTYNGSPTAPTNAGSYAVVGSLSNSNYDAVQVSGTLIISKADPVITWPAPVPVPLGTSLTSLQLSATADVAGSFVYSPDFGTVPAAGTQILNTTFTPSNTNNYNTVTKSVVISVYGNSNPTNFYERRGHIIYINTP